MDKYSIGIDIGGTNTTVALVNKKGSIKRKIKYSSNTHLKEEEFVQRIADRIAEITNNLPIKSIRGIGIGAAGLIDQDKGDIRYSPNMYRKNFPIVSLLRKSTGKKSLSRIPIFLDNDANVAAWGAYRMEVPSGVKDMICITLGTGVGGGIVINGAIHHGCDGLAGEIGHVAVDSEGPRCNCGSNGCLERYVGARYIVERTIKEIKKGKKTNLKAMVNGKLKDLTPEIIANSAKNGDVLAKKIWNETGEYLGIALASMVNILNTEVIVFCGGVSHAGNLYLEPLKKVVQKRSYVSQKKKIKYIISKMGDKLGVVGAALLVEQPR